MFIIDRVLKRIVLGNLKLNLDNRVIWVDSAELNVLGSERWIAVGLNLEPLLVRFIQPYYRTNAYFELALTFLPKK